MLADPERRIPAAAAVKLLEDSAQPGGCDTFGLRMAESRQLSDFGVVSLLLIHQPTLRDALMTTMQYRHLLNELLAIHVEERGRTVVIREEFVPDAGTDLAPGDRTGARRAVPAVRLPAGPALEAAQRELHPRRAGEPAGAPARVPLRHGVRPRVQRHRLRRRRPRTTATRPPIRRWPATSKRLVEALPAPAQNSIATDVRKDLYILMPMGQATIEQVARGRGMNVRTLQRRLEEAGETFSDMLNSVRTELALRYMENRQYSLQEVGRLLGFSRAQFVHALVQRRVRHVAAGVAQGSAAAHRAGRQP